MHPHDGRVVSNFIVQALKGQDITVYGDGGQTRSFCYVDDLVEAMMRMMATDHEVTGPINIGNPNEFTIRELAELVIEFTGTQSRLIFEKLPSDDPEAAPARYFRRARGVRLGAEDAAARRAGADDRLFRRDAEGG